MSLTAAELKAVYAVDEGELDKSLKGIPSKVKAVAGMIAGAAGLIGGGLAVGISEGMDREKLNDKLAAQLGAGGSYAADLGKIAGSLYAGAYGDSLGEVNDALRSVLQAGLLPEDATNKQIEGITAKVMNLSSAFDQDLGGATNAVAQMLRTGLAKNANEAMDILTRGFQQGDDKAGDLLDTVNEYGTQFRKLGIDGTTAMGLISQGLKAGARDSDIVADALKEFSIRAVDGSKLTAQGFKAVGQNADEMVQMIGKGGPTAQQALGQVLEGLRSIKDPAEQAQAATALFGTQAEDLGQALFAIDPFTAVSAMGDVAGAADKMGQTLNDNASSNLESFKRQISTAFVDFLGGKALPVIQNVAGWLATNFGPALSAVGDVLTNDVGPAIKNFGQWVSDNQTPIAIIAGIIAAVFIPHLIALGVTSTVTGLRIVAGWLIIQAQTIAAAAVHSAQITWMISRWIALGVAAVAQGAIIAGVWTASIIASAVSGAASFAVQVARVVAGWVLMGVQSLIRAAQMAAAWLIAMGPVGWVIAAVVGLVALIVANWDTVVKWTKAAWNWVVGAIKTAVQFMINLFLNFTLVGLIIKHWDTIKRVFSEGVSAAVGFVKGLPGRVVSALGNAGKWLWNVGKDMINGLIDGAGSLLKNIGKFFLNLVPGWIRGPLESALGIGSPSKVFAQYGRDIGQGLINGVASMRPAVAAEMLALADTQALTSLTPGTAGTAAPGAGAGAAGGRGPLFAADTVNVIEGTPDDVARQLELGARTRGNW